MYFVWHNFLFYFIIWNNWFEIKVLFHFNTDYLCSLVKVFRTNVTTCNYSSFDTYVQHYNRKLKYGLINLIKLNTDLPKTRIFTFERTAKLNDIITWYYIPVHTLNGRNQI